MDNRPNISNMLQLETIGVSPVYVYPLFSILLITYLITIISNVGILVLIIMERSLQQPMYLLFCNLSFNDILGNTNVMPRILSDLLSNDRSISYVECVTQAFCNQTSATAAHTILMIMAFDRYVAICNPLRYSSVMTTSMVLKLSVCAWGFAILMVSVLLGLTIRLKLCRTLIVNMYCDNASLFKLSCQDVTINNIYGLAFTAVLLTSSMGSIALTYFRIVTICVTRNNKELNSKALQTCTSHLVVYMIMLWTGFISIIFHRIQIDSSYRKLSNLLFFIIPGNLNPIIYAIQTKELKTKMKKIFSVKVTQAQ
ncbi:olfactory receptor 8U1-like [Brienomyrus brachyistius]|uniref:olfactory receptor 8U1-like n=1 Tax=Brienomyrus brachyistius TaxID=42636 RepID=UPI0020B2F507|nr:olfactory receptor 8U1-like [Brienomyrus brachyistius]XP_048838545.1 olfactory receptor 8U1-like [Brienomyrus brachyistius]XP_048838546.1 olfactory receptor 8U1-like [Brienomyrus brachyistius]XP_048838548.1 olfactory receptor 8U1-like [Brienomyrus brachyistius]